METEPIISPATVAVSNIETIQLKRDLSTEPSAQSVEMLGHSGGWAMSADRIGRFMILVLPAHIIDENPCLPFRLRE